MNDEASTGPRKLVNVGSIKAGSNSTPLPTPTKRGAHRTGVVEASVVLRRPWPRTGVFGTEVGAETEALVAGDDEADEAGRELFCAAGFFWVCAARDDDGFFMMSCVCTFFLLLATLAFAMMKLEIVASAGL